MAIRARGNIPGGIRPAELGKSERRARGSRPLGIVPREPLGREPLGAVTFFFPL